MNKNIEKYSMRTNHFHVHGIGVCITEDSHSLDSKLSCRSHNTASDLSAVGNQNLVEHLRRLGDTVCARRQAAYVCVMQVEWRNIFQKETSMMIIIECHLVELNECAVA